MNLLQAREVVHNHGQMAKRKANEAVAPVKTPEAAAPSRELLPAADLNRLMAGVEAWKAMTPHEVDSIVSRLAAAVEKLRRLPSGLVSLADHPQDASGPVLAKWAARTVRSIEEA